MSRSFVIFVESASISGNKTCTSEKVKKEETKKLPWGGWKRRRKRRSSKKRWDSSKSFTPITSLRIRSGFRLTTSYYLSIESYLISHRPPNKNQFLILWSHPTSWQISSKSKTSSQLSEKNSPASALCPQKSRKTYFISQWYIFINSGKQWLWRSFLQSIVESAQYLSEWHLRQKQNR